jgi:hypothetical protein
MELNHTALRDSIPSQDNYGSGAQRREEQLGRVSKRERFYSQKGQNWETYKDGKEEPICIEQGFSKVSDPSQGSWILP